MPKGNRIVLASRPVGEPKRSDFRVEEYPVPTPGEGQVLLRTIWLSLDPYMRGRMSEATSYAAPVPVGGVMEGGTVSEVIASNNAAFKEGDGPAQIGSVAFPKTHFGQRRATTATRRAPSLANTRKNSCEKALRN